MHTPQRHVLRCRRSQRHTLCCQAPLAGLAVPLSVARRGQRCQGFVYHARSTPAIARTRHTTRPGVQDSHTHLHLSSIHASISWYLSPACLPHSLFPVIFLCVDVCVCSCRLIGDALCAICSNPPPTHLPPFPLITRVGLTICVPVCSHSVIRGSLGGL